MYYFKNDKTEKPILMFILFHTVMIFYGTYINIVNDFIIIRWFTASQ